MPYYLLTIKAPKELTMSAYDLLIYYFKAHVKAVAFTTKPYEHLHAVIAVSCEISYKKAHKLLEELKAELGYFYVHFRRIWDKAQLNQAIDYVQAHKEGGRGDRMSEKVEERLDKLEEIVNKLADVVADMSEKLESLTAKQSKKAKPKAKKAEGRAEIYINQTKIAVIPSRKNGYKLLIFERKRESFKLWLSKDDWDTLRQFLDSYIAESNSRRKKGVKIVKGYRKAVER